MGQKSIIFSLKLRKLQILLEVRREKVTKMVEWDEHDEKEIAIALGNPNSPMKNFPVGEISFCSLFIKKGIWEDREC